jgi:hypothetical protein
MCCLSCLTEVKEAPCSDFASRIENQIPLLTARNVPVRRNFFPVNLRRELSKKSLQHSGFSLQYRPLEPQNHKIPCKIPCYIAGNSRGDRCEQRCVASQPVRRSETLHSVTSEMPANGGILRFGEASPGSEFGHCRRQIADSLRRIFKLASGSVERGNYR